MISRCWYSAEKVKTNYTEKKQLEANPSQNLSRARKWRPENAFQHFSPELSDKQIKWENQ